MRAFIFDTETDGLVKTKTIRREKWPRIIDFCGVIDEDGAIVDELDTLVNPGRMIANGELTAQITGIRNADVSSAPRFEAIADRIVAMIESCGRIVAHNLFFDKTMLEMEFERIDRKPPVFPELFCTVENTEHLTGKRMKLIDLHEHLLGERFEGAHRAKTDVAATTRIYRKLIEMGEA